MLPALRRSRRVRLVGVYTRTEAVRREVANEFGVPGYPSFEAMLADPSVEVVYLATPHDLHAAQTIACAAAGKHVLVEKPMALSEAEAAAMVQACAEAGVKLFVAFQFRHHPAHQRARLLVADGEIGEVVWAGARWTAQRHPDTGWRLDLERAGGTLLTARGVHLIDLIRFVTGSEYVSVSGMSDGLRPDHPADDVSLGMLGLASGGFAHILCTRLVPGADDGIEIRGTRGTIACRSTVSSEPEGFLVSTSESRHETLSYERCNVLASLIESVNAAVTGGPGSEHTATGEDGARVVAVTAALITSVQTGRIVTLARGEDRVNA